VFFWKTFKERRPDCIAPLSHLLLVPPTRTFIWTELAPRPPSPPRAHFQTQESAASVCLIGITRPTLFESRLRPVGRASPGLFLLISC